MDNYADYLYSYAVVRLSDAELAADVVQETFLSALKAREGFQGNSSEKTWLTAILKRKIIDIYRKRASSRESSYEDHAHNITDENFSRGEAPYQGYWKDDRAPNSHSLLPDGELENEELRRILEMCITHLPKNLADVFILKMIDEAKTEEICKELDITPSNLWVLMHRARLKLRGCLEENWMENG